MGQGRHCTIFSALKGRRENYDPNLSIKSRKQNLFRSN